MNTELQTIIVGRVIQILITIVSIRLLTSMLSEQEVGNYYLIASLLAFFNLVMLNPPGVFFTRHLLHWQESRNLLNAWLVLAVIALSVAFFAVLVSAEIYHILDYEGKFDHAEFLLLIFISLLIGCIHRNALFGINTLGNRVQFVVLLNVTLLLALLLSILLVNYYQGSALSWLLGVSLAELLTLYFVYRRFIQNNTPSSLIVIRGKLNKQYFRYVGVFVIPVAISTFLMWALGYSYRFIVDIKYSVELLAYISVGFAIASAVFSALESVAMQYYNPIFLREIKDSNSNERSIAWNKLAKNLVPIYILCLFFTVSASEMLLKVLVDEKFHDIAIYVKVGAAIEFFRVMTNMLNLVSQSELKTHHTVIPYFCGFIVAIGILLAVDFGEDYYLIPVTLLTSNIIVFFFMLYKMKMLLHIKYEVNVVTVGLFSIPFLVVVLSGINFDNILNNVVAVVVAGLYFLLSVWFVNRKDRLGI